jgi:hypothetical protein
MKTLTLKKSLFQVTTKVRIFFEALGDTGQQAMWIAALIFIFLIDKARSL